MMVVLAIVFGGGLSSAFAQERERQNAVFVDLGYPIAGLLLGGFGIGAGYERAFLPQISVRGNVGYIGYSNSDLDFMGFDIGAGLRYYPLSSAVGKFYIEGGFVYSPILIKHKGEEAASNIFVIAASLGWKVIYKTGFFLEPYIGYKIGIGELNMPKGLSSVSYDPSGLAYGIGLGWAF
jgi:hypothetical protein